VDPDHVLDPTREHVRQGFARGVEVPGVDEDADRDVIGPVQDRS
jgi:hypothetical protein